MTFEEPDIITESLRSLRERMGIDGQYSRDQLERTDFGHDGHLLLKYRGREQRFAVMVKANITHAHIARLREITSRSTGGTPLVYVTRHVSEPLARRLRDHHLLFIDTPPASSP